MKKKSVLQIVKLISSLIILLLLFSKIHISINELFKILLSVKLPYFFTSLAGVIIVLWVKSYRWHLILKNEGYPYNKFKAFKSYISSFSIGTITPGRLGEFIKVYNLKNDIKINSGIAFKSVLSDRLFDLIFLFWFGLSGIFVIFQIVNYKFSFYILILILSLLYLTILAVRLVIKKIIEKRTNSRKKLLIFINKCLELIIDKKSIAFWFITFLAYLVFFLSIQSLFYSINIKLNLINTAYIISLAGLVLLLPISIAGFGTREVSFVYLLSFYGISSEIAISFSLLQFLVFFVWGGLVGLFFFISSPISFEILKKDYLKIVDLFKR